MTVPARISIVTLGVSDLARSSAFYAALGWERCASSQEAIAWFRTADSNLGLFPVDHLAADAPATSRTRMVTRGRWRSIRSFRWMRMGGSGSRSGGLPLRLPWPIARCSRR